MTLRIQRAAKYILLFSAIFCWQAYVLSQEDPAGAPADEASSRTADQETDTPTREPIYLPKPLAEVLRLVKAGVDDEVIVAFIKRSPFGYAITAEQLVTLKKLGLSPKVLTALLEHVGMGILPMGEYGEPFGSRPVQARAREQAEAPAPSAVFIPGPPPVPPEITFADFYSALAPHGRWLNLPGVGWCWQPNVASGTDWQPYVDNGYWLWSKNGWYWNSGYPWGWAPFHYGRWFKGPRQGWLWRPDTDWSPAWVCWRRGEDYCGWAPLPPEATFNRDGWFFNDSPVGRDCGFSLPSSDFACVPYDHFADRRWQDHRLAEPLASSIFEQTRPENNYAFAANNHVNNWVFGQQELRGVPAGVEVVDREAAFRNASQLASASTSGMDQAFIPSGAESGVFSDTWTEPSGDSFFAGDAGGFSGAAGDGPFFGGADAGFGYGWGHGDASWHKQIRHSPRPQSHPPFPRTDTPPRSDEPWLPLGGRPASGNAPPWGTFGVAQASKPQNASPWGTFGIAPGSAQGAKRWGTFGIQAQTPADGSPWGTFGVQPQAPASGRPWGTFGVHRQTTVGESPWGPFNVGSGHTPGGGQWLPYTYPSDAPFLLGGGVGQPWGAPVWHHNTKQHSWLGHGVSYGYIGRGSIGYGMVGGMRTPGGAKPWLTMHRMPWSGYTPDYGGAHSPVLHNDGSHPWLPVGTHPGSEEAPPYGVFGVPPIPNDGQNPYLPFGQHLSSAGAPRGTFHSPYGGFYSHAVSSFANTLEGGFRYLPGGPMLPAAPTLPGGPMLPAAPTLPGGPYLGRSPTVPSSPVWRSFSYLSRWPSWPSAPSAPSWPSAPSAPSWPSMHFHGQGRGGWRGGGGHMGGGQWMGGGGVGRGFGAGGGSAPSASSAPSAAGGGGGVGGGGGGGGSGGR